MEIQKFEFNLFGENTYVIWNEVTHECAIVDPGMSDSQEYATLESFLTGNLLKPKYILLTHAHIDHTFGIDNLRTRYEAKIHAHKNDATLAATRGNQAKMFRLPQTLGPVEIDHFIDRNSTLCLGNEKILVLETPGHSPGGVCYYVPESRFVLTGDTLFRGSIGRTDLPGGNMHQLTGSIRARLFELPADTIVYPGHGPATTIGFEKANNPYVTL